LLRTGLPEACFCAGTVKQKARMNVVHPVFLGFQAAPLQGSRALPARVLPRPPKAQPRARGARTPSLSATENA
jgi:hypothetical protein